MAVGKTMVNLMRLGRHKLCAPGLRDAAIRNRFRETLTRSGGNATTYPIDHETEHGRLHYFVRGMLESFDPGALIEVANKGGVLAMAVLPGLGQVIGQMTKGEMPIIWKLNQGAGATFNGDSVTVPLYTDVDAAMRVAVDNGARFWGATYYHGSTNSPEMLRQIAEMDEAGARHGLGGVVWNYPRGSLLKGGDAEVFNQLDGFEAITNVCTGSLVLVKEKVSTLPGTAEEWEKGDLRVHKNVKWGQPGEKDQDETAIRDFLSLDRAGQISYMVALQHDRGVPSLMSGGAPQKPEQFSLDVADGLGTTEAGTLGTKHMGLIAGRSTTRQIRKGADGKFDISGAVKHMQMLRDAAPIVTIEV